MVKTKSKDIGTKFETACVKLFKEAGFEARRLALSGSHDQGDVELIAPHGLFVVECKCYRSWSRGDVEVWRAQTLAESLNYENNFGTFAQPTLIVSQFNKSNMDSYVHLWDLKGWIQMYLDEFILNLGGTRQ